MNELYGFSIHFFLSTPIPHPTTAYATMCHLRQVRNIYTCGHGITEPDVMIHCENRFCKFDRSHPKACANCSKTCYQYRTFPEQYNPHIQAPCPVCNAEAVKKARGKR